MTIDKSICLRIAVPAPLRRFFDYLPPKSEGWENLQPGMRVKVPFHRREMVGIFMEFTSQSNIAKDRLKAAIEILDTEPMISKDILQLCMWAADYYHHPIGEVLSHALPVLLRQGKPATDAYPVLSVPEQKTEHLVLNSAQKAAVLAIEASQQQFGVFLLNGVTGSGKTEVYLQAMTTILAAQKQVLILVPEIGLTPQTIQRFRERFLVPVVAIHSGLTDKKRLHAWYQARSGEARIIIGTRSAVFSSFKQLGLIIVDEEHDLSFKQQDGFRYHARDFAIMRAHLNQIPIVLGSATPALETLHNAEQGKYHSLLLPERAGNAELPKFEVLDIRNKPLEHGISKPLIEEIKNHLARGEQVMLFLNRRGFSPVLLCHACGWMAICKRCDMRMTYHQHSNRLHCHHCEAQKSIPKKCEACDKEDLLPIGLGTERLESVIEKYFKEASIARIDRDSTQRKGAIEKILQEIHSGQHQILIGTQMLAKGHHFPDVTLVAIVDADGGFFSSDFRALERMGQLLIQVSGRAGRLEKPGKVIVQTHYPDHVLLQQLLNENYQKFAETVLQERKTALLPPYSYFALFRAEALQITHASEFLQQIKSSMNLNKNIQVLGPIPAPQPRRAGRYRIQLLLQAKQRQTLQSFLKELLPVVEKIPIKNRVRWSLDVDPLEMF